MLMTEPEIAQAVITGEGRTGLSALVVPAEGHDAVGVALALTRVNMRLSVTERLRKHAVVEPFTLENGLLTPTQKIRRLLVLRAHADIVATLH
jgi:long-chain acyl-CoA synthetase